MTPTTSSDSVDAPPRPAPPEEKNSVDLPHLSRKPQALVAGSSSTSDSLIPPPPPPEGKSSVDSPPLSPPSVPHCRPPLDSMRRNPRNAVDSPPPSPRAPPSMAPPLDESRSPRNAVDAPPSSLSVPSPRAPSVTARLSPRAPPVVPPPPPPLPESRKRTRRDAPPSPPVAPPAPPPPQPQPRPDRLERPDGTLRLPDRYSRVRAHPNNKGIYSKSQFIDACLIISNRMFELGATAADPVSERDVLAFAENAGVIRHYISHFLAKANKVRPHNFGGRTVHMRVDKKGTRFYYIG